MRLHFFASILYGLIACCSLSSAAQVMPIVEHFTKIPPIVRHVTPTSVTFSVQYDPPLDNPPASPHAVYIFREGSEQHNGMSPMYVPLSEHNKGISFFTVDNLLPDSVYHFRVGWTRSNQKTALSWSGAHHLRIHTSPIHHHNEFSFIAGSCRKLGEIWGIPIWNKKGDKVFDAMIKDIQTQDRQTDLVMFIGDQIYADATYPIGDAKTFEQYARRYELAFTQPHMASVLSSGVPIYMMRDDHDFWNDCNADERAHNQERYDAAMQAYNLYQRPYPIGENHYWFTVSQNVDIFFMDTRSERSPSHQQIISPAQMDAFKEWLNVPSRAEQIKVVVTSVPIFLLQTEDSWGGYREQLKEVVDFIVDNRIRYVTFVSGDAHCQSDGLFQVINSNGDVLASFAEILTSGLFSINHNKSLLLTDYVDLRDRRGAGYQLRTVMPLQSALKERSYARISGNHEEKTIRVDVINHKGEILRSNTHNLENNLSIVKHIVH